MRLKYRIPLAIISICMVLTLFVASSYALWKVTIYQETENLIDAGCFSITFEENSSSINLNNTYPMASEVGMRTVPYIFTIKNTCTVDAKYTLYLNTLEVEGNKIEDSLIDYAIVKTDGAVAVANKLSTAKKNIDTSHFDLGKNIITSYEIGTGSLKGATSEGGTDGGSATYSLRLWIDEAATTAINGYSFEAGLSVTSTATKLKSITAVEKLSALAETSEELAYDGTVDNNLRYIGANPNNYVSFNNELWRIIGVMNNITDSTGKKESHIKIIRVDNIGSTKWDENNINNWNTSTLKNYLNEDYYNSFTAESKNMTSNVIWNLGGGTNYTSERGTTVYSGNPTTWTGKVGLIYLSDYEYAVGGNARDECLSSGVNSYFSNCQTNDWIYQSGLSQWTLNVSSDSNSIVYALSGDSYESFYGYGPSYNAVASPVLYLIPNVEIIDGDGSKENPFLLQ